MGTGAARVALQAPGRVSHLLAVNAAHPWLAQRRLIPQLWRFWCMAMLAAVVRTADHVARDRAAWDRLAAGYAGRGLCSWAVAGPCGGHTNDWI